MAIHIGENNVFLLNTKNCSYSFSVDQEGLLRHLYWGSRIDAIEDFKNEPYVWEQGFHPIYDVKREECSSFGTMRFKETSFKVTFADGVRDFRYRYIGHTIDKDELTVILEDTVYPLQMSLHYKVYEEVDIIEKRRTVKNGGSDVVTVERLHSGECSLPGAGWNLKNFNGMWNSDFDAYEQKITGGKTVLESLRGATGHVANPSFVLHQNAGETYGEVYYGALAWSGNFKIVLEQTPYEYLNILAGMGDTDFEWRLTGGTTLETPALYLGYSPDGFDRMSNSMGEFARKYVMPEPMAAKPLSVLYNSWEATYFDVNEQAQLQLIEKAAQVGVELFVMDDGWFGQRKDDHAGLGDWQVNTVKFPNGLAPLTQKLKSCGMHFGLWIEPEMVNQSSELYRAHPDWVYHYASRPVMEGRYQYMLDLTRQDVQDYIIGEIDRLLTENDISYIKWDMNRGISEVASAMLDRSEFKSIWYRHTKGFYHIIQSLRALHPEVEWEACASGGGRVDYGAMPYFDEFWPSDNTDPLDRLSIQEGYSYLYPIKYMRAWVTDSGSNGKRAMPLLFRLHCSMCGALGIGLNLNESTEEDTELLKKYVTLYKEVRPIIQFGQLHRLASLQADGLQAVQYENGEDSVLFAFLDHPSRWRTTFTIRPRGLDANTSYRVEIEGQQQQKYSGAFLMNSGLRIILNHDYASCMVRLLPDR
ncbi:alpha-galactosidase [Paenibacillus lignilyticus]|uniref:Alpha-galactosidase n=1 Tax=Paenibacillus lignilyticus TaxID=1172615 RepID=A0ABS5CAI9_9BACL|nr:alpha-galactosidase [Paenibacillus lignilyticus]MBP3962958.1 alpha-galactosidase [Paenibacillus lignilyticus]